MQLVYAVKLMLCPPTQHASVRAKDFWDISWGNIPSERLGNLVPIVVHPRGGLLGGAPKMSKLAALAAARKKQVEESKAAAGALQSGQPADFLHELSTKRAFGSNAASTVTLPILSESSSKDSGDSSSSALNHEETDSPIPAAAYQSLETSPSVFAQTLCRVSLQLDKPHNQFQTTLASLSQPYSTKKSYASAGLFSKPSPDDVVLAAQSKGSLRS
jgi:elongation factor 1 alpha-like protein